MSRLPLTAAPHHLELWAHTFPPLLGFFPLQEPQICSDQLFLHLQVRLRSEAQWLGFSKSGCSASIYAYLLPDTPDFPQSVSRNSRTTTNHQNLFEDSPQAIGWSDTQSPHLSLVTCVCVSVCVGVFINESRTQHFFKLGLSRRTHHFCSVF